MSEATRDSWNALIAQHDRRVLLALLAEGVRIDRARDLAQETWIRLIEQQRLGRLERIELPGLAIRQAQFLAREDRRRRAMAGADTETLQALPDPAAAIDERYLTREQLARALGELETCPESSRRVFRLIYDNPDLSHADAAAQVGLSVQRVHQILCEVRKRLRAAIGE